MTDRSDPAALDDDAFRRRFRAWLEAHVPAEFRRPFVRLAGDDAVRWNKLLFDHGYRAPAWSREHGGMGLSIEKQIIYQAELDRLRVSRTIDLGVGLLGTTLMRFGTEAQKARYLPPILSSDEIWCQGYSEPNAGSDLASLQTRGRIDGDRLIVTGQKIWVTHAMFATHIFLLVRTNSEGPKQAGITFALVDLRTPGIRIRPIANLTGEAEFAEVFFDDVSVPLSDVVGEVDQGWLVTQALLGTERLGLGSPIFARLALEAYDDATARLGMRDEPAVIVHRRRFHVALHAIRCLYRDAGAALSDGRDISRDLPILKLASSELLQRVTEALIELGTGPLLSDATEAVIDPAFLYLIARPTTIFGGTSEIQRNILAKQLLQLPAN